MGHAGVTGRPTSTGEVGEHSPAQGKCDGMRTDLDEAHDRETSSASGYSRYDQYELYQRQGTGPANRVPKEGYDVEEYQPAGDMRMSPTAPSKKLQSTPDLKLTCRAHHPDGAGRNHGTAESCLTRMHEAREDQS